MNKISFSGWEKGYRTIEKKYQDFNSIDDKIDFYNKRNSDIQNTINILKTKLGNIVQSFQHVKGMDSTEINQKTKDLNKQISQLEEEMNENKNILINLWYGYHERL